MPDPIPCPRCQAPMASHRLDARLGRAVAIDLCVSCQCFWFDTGESLQLTPGSTLKLFQIVGEQADRPHPGMPAGVHCPRCRAPLRVTHDMQRGTRFEYLSCPNGHGRLITFFNFLREKNFIRPLSPKQIAELRENVHTVNCSNCGAPVDVAIGAACPHCGSPLSMLDMAQTERVISELREAGHTATPIDADLALTLEHIRRSTGARFDAFDRDSAWYETAASAGLVGAGLSAVARWLRKV